MALFPECVKLRVVVSWVDVEMCVRQLSSRCVGLSVYNTVVLPLVEDATHAAAGEDSCRRGCHRRCRSYTWTLGQIRSGARFIVMAITQT